MARPLVTLLAGLSIIATPLPAPAEAQRGDTAPLAIACRADRPKEPVTAEICALFAERVAARYPGRAVRLQTAHTALTLVLLEAGRQRFVARIDHAAGEGLAQGTARFDAPLDAAARAALIDRLLEAAPQL
ncbi:hypothetical protein [Rhodobacter maris]|uniref:Uncharacterized protein n=1 Tax=Rhodobacter maris TaxID=446682 RepID=A0A285SEV1_9RHOB|nr:hypothetical protein [Rhodobacter maris]SOC06414.1 hypothetical protein SAMN05877831_10512 [Rhodobacter maris]